MQDLETEIFLHILHQHGEAVSGLAEDVAGASVKDAAAAGDGMASVRLDTSLLLVELAFPTKVSVKMSIDRRLAPNSQTVPFCGALG